MTADEIETRLRAALAPQHLQVQDDSHLHAGHAGAREGRHRLVYDSLGPLGAQGVHALAIVAELPPAD